MRRALLVGSLVVLVGFVIVVVVFWTDSAHWFLRYTGADAESGTWYGFWSGFGGAIPDFLILGSIITVYRHHNCHVKGCLRLGKPVDGTPYVACPTHHPAARRQQALGLMGCHRDGPQGPSRTRRHRDAAGSNEAGDSCGVLTFPPHVPSA